MIIDKQLTFSEEQAITSTADSTNVLDLGGANMNTGEPVEILCQVEEAFTSGGSTTLTVSLVTDDNEAFSSATTLITTAAIPKASLVQGFNIPISFLPANVERFVKLVFTVATGPFTAGKINSGLVLARQTNR